jgi:hypothetical protein
VQHVAKATTRGRLVYSIVLGAHREVRLEFLAYLLV